MDEDWEKIRERVLKENMERRDREKKIEEWNTKRSKCLKPRLRHYFREPRTRALTPDLKCKWCGKTVAQVRAEQRRKI